MASLGPSAPVKSALRTLDILELVAQQSRPLTAQEIAETLGIPVSSLSYLLSTLVDRGYLDRDRRQYRLGPSIARLSRADAELSLSERATPIVRAITRELNETAGFFVLHDFEIEAVARDIGLHALRYTIEIGQRAPLHAFAAGKAMLATMSDKQLDQYFRSVERKIFTPQTIHEEKPLRAAIAQVRRDGIARTFEEHTPGITGMARAVVVDGKAVGAFSIAMPLARCDAEKEKQAFRLLNRAVGLMQNGEVNGWPAAPASVAAPR
ncbi:MAG: IclR family transcriptional regulator [Allosphingosinicella sp.]